MAQSMRDIKDKITSTQSTSQITKAMQMVSAAKLTKSEAKTKNYHHYMQTLEDMVHHMACKCLERFGIEAEGYRRWMEQ